MFLNGWFEFLEMTGLFSFNARSPQSLFDEVFKILFDMNLDWPLLIAATKNSLTIKTKFTISQKKCFLNRQEIAKTTKEVEWNKQNCITIILGVTF